MIELESGKTPSVSQGDGWAARGSSHLSNPGHQVAAEVSEDSDRCGNRRGRRVAERDRPWGKRLSASGRSKRFGRPLLLRCRRRQGLQEECSNGLAGLLIVTARVPLSAPPGIAKRVPAVGVREPISA